MQLLYSLCLVIAAHQADQADLKDTRVSLTVPASSARLALEALSKKSRFRFTCSQSMASEIVLLQVSDVSLLDLMARIAQVTTGKWEPDETGYVLIRDVKRASEQAQAERQKHVDFFRKCLARYIEQNPLRPSIDEGAASNLVRRMRDLKQTNWLHFQDLKNASPTGRLTARIMAGLQAEAIADIPIGERRVFSTRPTRMQLPLYRADGIVAEFLREQEILAKRIDSDLDRTNRDVAWMVADIRGRTAAGDEYAKAFVIVQKLSEWQVSVQVQVVDGSGSELGSSATSLSDGDLAKGESPLQLPVDRGTHLRLGAASKQLLNLLHDREKSEEQCEPIPVEEVLPAELLEALSKPESIDPLQMVIGEALLQVGEDDQADVVACIADAAMSAIRWLASDALTPHMVLKAAGPNEIVDYKWRDGWLEVTPFMPAAERKARFDRAALGAFAKVSATRFPSLNDYALLAARSPRSPQYGTLAEICYLPLFDSSKPEDGPPNPEVLRFYGLLSPSQKQALIGGRGLQVGGLTPAQIEVLNRLVYFELEPALTATLEQAPDPNDRIAGTDEPVSAAYSLQDSTEALPLGLPRSGRITLDRETSEVLRGFPLAAASYAMAPEDVASYIGTRERPDLFPGKYRFPDMKRFQVGTLTYYTLNFFLTDRLSMMHGLQDSSFPDTRQYTLSSLPQGIKKAIDAALAEFREGYKAAQPVNPEIKPPVTKPPPSTL